MESLKPGDLIEVPFRTSTLGLLVWAPVKVVDGGRGRLFSLQLQQEVPGLGRRGDHVILESLKDWRYV